MLVTTITQNETKSVKPFGNPQMGHFKSPSSREPYEVTELVFDLEHHTILITLGTPENRKTLMTGLRGYRSINTEGHIPPHYEFEPRGSNQIFYEGPIDVLLEFLEMLDFISPSTIEKCPVKPKKSEIVYD